ncbi:hypothetical protein ACNKU7_06205 [Microbulbifer sp. SA54]|uniref:hypothetical protein n=1 Tax=Microbulbifer sp. SA54 TaxID=3401577 RepID=UPI003AAC6FB7
MPSVSTSLYPMGTAPSPAICSRHYCLRRAGAGLLQFTEQPKVASYALIALAILEQLHIRFRQVWWLTRQMWGKRAGSEVTLTIVDDGIQTQNANMQTVLL